MANYLMKYKGKYRIKAEYDLSTNDVPRNHLNEIEESFDDLYILCGSGMKIYHFHRDILTAYVPSLKRGRNLIKSLEEKNVPYTNYKESDDEIFFNFKSKDIETVAELMKARTSGSNISPFSVKNLAKSDVEIPSSKMKEYKEITSRVGKNEMLLLHRLTSAFLESVLEKKYKENDKSFDYKTDMKKMKLARQTKEYIFMRGLWQEYMNYLDTEITNFYSNK